MSRRKLPAPPLVLQPVFARVRQGSPQATLLLELASFLERLGLLTDGGRLNLSGGLAGRNRALSLTTQDVRSWAHAMVVELWENGRPEQWKALADDYSHRFDRGKPRRPNRLQRLYCEWSCDLGPIGYLQACQQHHHLWQALRAALDTPVDLGPDHQLMRVALSARDQGSLLPVQEVFASTPTLRKPLLLALPYLSLSAESRLDWADQLALQFPDLGSEILQSCRSDQASARRLPHSLANLCLQLLRENSGFANPRWLASLRAYRWPAGWADQVQSSIASGDEIRCVVYGPRPGTLWLDQLLEEGRRRSLAAPEMPP